ncbi:MAG TPA: hypothetical protein VGM85_03555 [Paraburkholderia sp.]|jgi:hypothetical protein
MEKKEPFKLSRDDPMWSVAKAIEHSVRAIRKARGRKNPEDCVPGSHEHELVLNEFLSDVLTSIAEPDDEADEFGAGATG